MSADANHIISFSGGLSSGRMLRLKMDQEGSSFDKKYAVHFNNTGREYNETLDFVNEVSMRWGVPILWTEYCRKDGEHSFKVVDYATAARRTSERGPFDEMLEWAGALPNARGRGCSGQLKVRTSRRYLQSIGLESWRSYIGIRSDEQERILEILSACPKYITPCFPLNEACLTKSDVDAWWVQQPFTLNIPNYKGNCDLCFLKARWKRRAIIREDPTAADWWIGWERKMRERGVTGNGALWMAGRSYEGLLAEATHPEFDFTEQDAPCSCAVSGFREEVP